MENGYIFNKLKSYYEILCKEYNKNSILGVYLYGSQNYNLSDDNSDVDAKAIYIPSLLEISYNMKPLSKEIHTENGEHIVIKDIRLMVEMFQKQSLNFLEILFTPYCYINEDYYWLNEKLRKEAKRMSKYDEKKMFLSLIGQFKSSTKASLLDSNKKLAEKLYLFSVIEKLFNGETFSSAIVLTEKEKAILLPLKRKEGIPSREDISKVLDKVAIIDNFQKDNIKNSNISKEYLDRYYAEAIKAAILFKDCLNGKRGL